MAAQQHAANSQTAGPLGLQGASYHECKRRSHIGRNMTGHNSACMWSINLPKLKKLGYMFRKAITSTSRQSKGCDQLRDIMHGTTSPRQICCKAQLVQQSSAQPSNAGMSFHMYWQQAESKAGLPWEGYLWWYDSNRNCQVLDLRQTRLVSAPRKGCYMTPASLAMLAEGSPNQLDTTK